jgi:hypothetical protein
VRQRLPLVLSALALVVSLLGATPLGEAAGNAARVTVAFADNAGKLNGHVSSVYPKPGQIPVLDPSGKLAPALRFDARKVRFVRGPATPLGVAESTVVTATCPEGTFLIGGGFDVHLIEAGNPRVDATRPTVTRDGWEVVVYNIPIIDPQTQRIATHTGRGRSYAVCGTA